MRCSIVIPVHNRASLTRQCLETIFADPALRDRAEVVVVDDGSSDGTPELLRRFGDDLRIVRHDAATGFATACNDGAAAAREDALVFLNNDTIPITGWLEALVGHAEAHPDAAVVGAKLLFPNDTIQHAGMTIDEDHNPRHIYAGFPADHPAVNRSLRVPAVTAACALFRRGPFEAAGGFDDAFRNGFEDVDLCLRLGEQGHQIHYCHESVAYHLEMGTRDFRDELPNLELYRRRWAHKVRPDAMSRYAEDGLLRADYGLRYPFTLEVSPLLAVIEEAERTREAERRLADQREQIAQLLRENVELRLLVGEAGLELPAPTVGLPRADLPSSPRAVLFASAAYGDAMRYRCEHHAEELALLGATADSRWLHELPLAEISYSYGCFVLHRVPADEHVLAFVEEAQQQGKVVIYDADELVFDSGGDEEQRRQAQTLEAADAVFVATEPLAERARSLNPNVFVLPIVAGRELVEQAEEAVRERAASSTDEVRLAYVAPAATGTRDFLEAADAVLAALEDRKALHLSLIGDVELDGRFRRYAERIEQVPALPWRRLLRVLAYADVVLAPQEAGNPAAEARPCRQWLEAALVATPTVASRQADFVRVVENGTTGLLADGRDEWHAALGELLGSSGRRVEIGRAASCAVRASQTTAAQAGLLYDALARVAGAKVRNRKLTVNVIGSSGGAGSADGRRAAELAGRLGWRGHHVRLFADSVPRQVRASVDVCDPAASPLPAADVTLATDVRRARAAAAEGHALFTFVLADGAAGETAADLHVRRLPYPRPGEVETLERRLLELCFARLDPTWREAAGD